MISTPYLLSFVEGVLSFVSPCILPLLPIYIFYLAGVTEQAEIRRPRLITNSIAFVLGLTLVFVALGATASLLGQYLQENILLLRRLSGIVMIVLGLNFTGLIRLSFLNVNKHLSYRVERLNVGTSVLFGMVFAFGWTPCVGAFLGSALLLASNSESIRQGIILLAFYSVGLGAPFILFAALFERAGGLIKALQRYNRVASIVSGLVLILAGVLMFTDRLWFIGFGSI